MPFGIKSECKINPKFIFCCKDLDLDLTVTGLVTKAIIKRQVRLFFYVWLGIKRGGENGDKITQ